MQYKNVLFFLLLFVMASVAFSQSTNQQQENQKQKSVLDRLEQLERLSAQQNERVQEQERKINELERLASIRANKIVAWMRYGEDTERCYRLHIKRIGTNSFKFWSSGDRGTWRFMKADGTLIHSTGWVPNDIPSFWNMPTSESNAPPQNCGILCLDTSITSQKQTPKFVWYPMECNKLIENPNIHPLVWYEYEFVIPLVHGDFIEVEGPRFWVQK